MGGIDQDASLYHKVLKELSFARKKVETIEAKFEGKNTFFVVDRGYAKKGIRGKGAVIQENRRSNKIFQTSRGRWSLRETIVRPRSTRGYSDVRLRNSDRDPRNESTF